MLSFMQCADTCVKRLSKNATSPEVLHVTSYRHLVVTYLVS
jgi:hypothetical protein